MIDLKNTKIAFAHKGALELRKAYVLFKILNSNSVSRLGTSLAELALKLRLPIDPIVKHTIFAQFCGGVSLEDCADTISNLEAAGISVNLDYAVEGKGSDADFEATVEELLRIVALAENRSIVRFISLKVTAIAPKDLLEKNISSGTEDDKQKLNAVRSRLHRICKAASDSQMALFVDAEESWMQGVVDSLVEEMMAVYNQKQVIVYNTFQMYRHDRLQFFKDSISRAKQGGYLLGAKNVRGAYLEQENERAQSLNQPSPMHKSKEDTDRDYNLALDYAVEHWESLAFCAATHNEESCLHLAEKLETLSDEARLRFCFAQLQGMSDHITYNLARAGYPVCKYVPYGPVAEVVPYLIRRAQENTSIAGQSSRELQLLEQEMDRRRKEGR